MHMHRKRQPGGFAGTFDLARDAHAPERGEIALLEHDPKPGESGRPAPSSLPFSDSRAFLTSWTIWTDHFGDKDFLFALVLPSVFFFVAIGRSKIGDAH